MIKTSKVLPCEFKFLKNGKLYCRTHKQSLVYVYRVPSNEPTFKIVCQVFEDQLAEECHLLRNKLSEKKQK